MASRRSQRISTVRPFEKTVKFNASIGEFEYWDKAKSENVSVPTLEFTPLVTKGRLSGFYNAKGAQVFSNYIESSKDEEFKAFIFQSGKPTNLPELSGFWADIKEEASKNQIHFTQSIIGIAVIDGVEEVVELIVFKSSLSSWISIQEKSKSDVMSSKVTLTKGRLMKKGNGKELIEVTKKEEDEINKKLAKNPRANTPIIFYEFVASDVTELNEKEMEYTDEKITAIDEYFDSQSGERQNTRPSRTNESVQTDGGGGDDDDDLPF